MDKKAWIIFSVLVVTVFGGLVFLSGKNRVDVGDNNATVIQPATEESGGIADHVFGNAKAKVTLVEYGDFQCPGCNAAYPNVKVLIEKYKDQIAFVFRNFPLTSLHPNALAAASAAEAAGLQGKYWEMNDLIFSNTDEWKASSPDERTDLFSGYAKSLGLDIGKFTSDMGSEKVSKKIAFDLALGKKQGVSGTPGFFLEGEKVADDIVEDVMQQNGDKLDAAIKAALQKNSVTLPR